MPTANAFLLEALKKHFNPTSSQDPEWKALLPIIAALQTKGLNEHGDDNPFATTHALEQLKEALLQSNLRQNLFPNLNDDTLRHMLSRLTIKGRIDLPEIYSFCAKQLLYVTYQQNLWTPEEIIVEIEKRIDSKPEQTSNVLINALSAMEASQLHQYYSLDARFGSLTHEKAKTIYDRFIKYQTNEEDLEIVRTILNEAPKDISASDLKSLLLRIQDRKNLLQSEKEIYKLSRAIQAIDSEQDLTNMEFNLQNALGNPKQLNNPYCNLHPSINGQLQRDIQSRKIEIQCMAIAHHKKNNNHEEEKELLSSSEWVSSDELPTSMMDNESLQSGFTSPGTLSTITNPSILEKSPSSSDDSTQIENYKAPKKQRHEPTNAMPSKLKSKHQDQQDDINSTKKTKQVSFQHKPATQKAESKPEKHSTDTNKVNPHAKIIKMKAEIKELKPNSAPPKTAPKPWR